MKGTKSFLDDQEGGKHSFVFNTTNYVISYCYKDPTAKFHNQLIQLLQRFINGVKKEDVPIDGSLRGTFLTEDMNRSKWLGPIAYTERTTEHFKLLVYLSESKILQ